MPVDTHLDVKLRERLKNRFWRDDLAKLPRQLYPHRTEADLYALWWHEFAPLFAENLAVTNEALALFTPATEDDMLPRYLAGDAGNWYALVTLRYNQRTRYRFCYVRYWWALDHKARAEMVEAINAAWITAPFDWIKFRLGCSSTLTPGGFCPQAVLQTYVVAGCPESTESEPADIHPRLTHLTIEQPTQLEASWWRPYRALLIEQERLAPGLMEDWNDFEVALNRLKTEMALLLQEGGSALNLWQGNELIGHISWRPHSYREQLIKRCWHINNVIVRASDRQQGLGEALHRLALSRMNLSTASIVAGLIRAGNEPSLKTAEKMGRYIIDRYLIVPKIEG